MSAVLVRSEVEAHGGDSAGCTIELSSVLPFGRLMLHAGTPRARGAAEILAGSVAMGTTTPPERSGTGAPPDPGDVLPHEEGPRDQRPHEHPDERLHLERAGARSAATVRLALCGDVMLGRGIDQILPHPGDPTLRESHMRDARGYVELAEAANGPIPRPVGHDWPWGEALPALTKAQPDARILNLETSITRSGRFASDKRVHYRMSPDNVGCLTAAEPDVCALANNHVLDLGRPGLEETLEVLASAGLPSAGAGRDRASAWEPAAVPLQGGGRVLVLSLGATSSGIPPAWAATRRRPGVALLADDPDANPGDDPDADAEAVLAQLARWRQPGDHVVASIHWGANWGYAVPAMQVRLAHALVDGGVDVVHGHSSHHPRPVEVHRGRPILYGCGDLINDYEGIGGREGYRSDLRVLFVIDLDRHTGALQALRMLPFQARRLRLHHASEADAAWLRDVLDRVSRPHGAGVSLAADGALALEWT